MTRWNASEGRHEDRTHERVRNAFMLMYDRVVTEPSPTGDDVAALSESPTQDPTSLGGEDIDSDREGERSPTSAAENDRPADGGEPPSPPPPPSETP